MDDCTCWGCILRDAMNSLWDSLGEDPSVEVLSWLKGWDDQINDIVCDEYTN